MLEVFAHSYLPHQFVLVPIHPCQLTHMSKYVLNPVCQLKSVNVSKAILHVGVNGELRKTKDLATEMKGVPESTLLPLFRCQSLDGLQVEVVVEMEVVEVLSVDE